MRESQTRLPLPCHWPELKTTFGRCPRSRHPPGSFHLRLWGNGALSTPRLPFSSWLCSPIASPIGYALRSSDEIDPQLIPSESNKGIKMRFIRFSLIRPRRTGPHPTSSVTSSVTRSSLSISDQFSSINSQRHDGGAGAHSRKFTDSDHVKFHCTLLQAPSTK